MTEVIPDVFSQFGEPEGVAVVTASGGRLSPTGTPSVNDVTPRPLFNQRKPARVLQAERPEHRAIIMMKASAMSNVEIAQTLEISPVTVATIVKQPWAAAQILEEIEKAGREPVMQLLKVAALDAAQRLIDIAEGAENDETRRKANNDILDRTFGKSTNHVSVTTKAAASMTDEELAAIARRDIKN